MAKAKGAKKRRKTPRQGVKCLESVFSAAFRDAAVTGRGYIQMTLDKDGDPQIARVFVPFGLWQYIGEINLPGAR